ncbi:hypothetical protein GH714_038065 [Hevea brasiliensis]|uniref:20 kDa chaperonin, chloroplastic n=1 Tax=Hevea brasiliensis TaxID=3981 RepID=A0A6A6KFK5_HEVBR|nr:hypothetical protein GH714_038065 [Hevea brasiliensis]
MRQNGSVRLRNVGMFDQRTRLGPEMATTQLTASSVSVSARNLASFEGLRPSTVKFASFGTLKAGSLAQRSFRGLVVKAATLVAPKYTSIKPLGDRVLVKIKVAEEKTDGGILLPTSAQTKPQGGETGTQVVFSKYAGTEVEFNGSSHLILKEMILSVAEAEEKTSGGLLLTEATKEKPSIGTVVAVGPGTVDEEGNRKPLSVAPGNTVLYSKYAWEL